MQRRRFFASRPVQQVPGQRVEVAVQVRKEAAVAAEAVAAAAEAVQPVLFWVSPFEGMVGGDLRGSEYETADGLWSEAAGDDDGLVYIRERYPTEPEITTGWRGTPWRRNAQGVPYPSSGPDWRCEWIECTVNAWEAAPVCYTGFVVGVAPERVTWLLEWDRPYGGPDHVPWDVDWGDAASWNGHVARAAGCAVMVYVVLGGFSGEGRETLTATALVDGQAVGALTFVAVELGD